MADRLSSLDVSFLYLEGAKTPMHMGGLAVFEQPASGFDYDTLAQLIEQRISLVPRYRQKIKSVPGHLGSPVWVDDSGFDLTYHLRRSALPRPGSEDQLRELVGRVQSRPLDRNRPLWEMYLVEGVAGGASERFALITKTHQAMIDGISAIDIIQVILDASATPRPVLDDHWMADVEPGSVSLVVDAMAELIHRPGAVVDAARIGLADARSLTGRVGKAANALLSAARTVVSSAPVSPLNATIGSQRRFATAKTDLDDYKKVRKQADCTVNDAVLTTLTGAVRGWLLSRGESVSPASLVRAMVPLSVNDPDSDQPNRRVSSFLVDLPVGEPNPIVRLAQVSYAMKAHQESGQSVGADALVALSGFAPPTLHAMGARVASGVSRRLFNVVITNVPGPQAPLYAGQAKMLEMYPVVPLAVGQALSIGLTSYDGGVYFGLNADRDAMYDVDLLASLIEESLAELLAATGVPRNRRR
ncbi:WS/DGAT/MGAT family O-acyltransferase [Jatrophihabitans sp. DSM 45814]